MKLLVLVLSLALFPPAAILVNETFAMCLVGISPLFTVGQELVPTLFPSLCHPSRIKNVLSACIVTQRDIQKDGLLSFLMRN